MSAFIRVGTRVAMAMELGIQRNRDPAGVSLWLGAGQGHGRGWGANPV